MELQLDTDTAIGFALSNAMVTDDPEIAEAASLGRRLIARRAKDLTLPEENFVATARALRSGLPLVDLGPAIANGGLNDEGLPALAVSRPDAGIAECFYSGGAYTFLLRGGEPMSRVTAAFDISPWDRIVRAFQGGFEADVPMVPVEVRPTRWKPYHAILFQATWRRIAVLADPVLLRIFTPSGLAGILATWNMSEAEAKAVAEARRLRPPTSW